MHSEENDTASARAAAAERALLYPRVTSFRFRRGALTPAQQRNWERLWPTLGRDLAPAHELGDAPSDPSSPQARLGDPLDPAAWFGRDAPLVIEIGSGTGTSTAAMAAAEPGIDVIACEVYKSGIAQLLGLIDRGGLTNVRLIRGDAVVLLERLVTPGSVTGIRVFFPDPWPKARHHKRRLLQLGTFALFARAVRPGGVLHIATDHADYAAAVTEVVAAQPWFEAATGTALPISTTRPVTKFEGRAHTDGRDITEFVLLRNTFDDGDAEVARAAEAALQPAPSPAPSPTPEDHR